MNLKRHLLDRTTYKCGLLAHVGQIVGSVLRNEQVFDVLVATCAEYEVSIAKVEATLDKMRNMTQDTEVVINAGVFAVIVYAFVAIVERAEWTTYDKDGNPLDVDIPEGVEPGSATYKVLGFTHGNVLWAEDIVGFCGEGMKMLAGLKEASLGEGHYKRYRQKAQSARRYGKKIGRNEPCPCGKLNAAGNPVKFKKCCAEPRRPGVERVERNPT